MIREVQGDILHSGAAVIAHGVSPGDHFEQGLALQLRERWPAMVRDFRHFCRTTSPKPGSLWTWSAANGLRIINLLTQEAAAGEQGHPRPGRARIEYVNQALRSLRKTVETEKIESLALPRLATGVGALAWNAVLPLVERHLGDLNIPIYVYTEYRKGVPAGEGPRATAG